jgi:hypothetical protein
MDPSRLIWFDRDIQVGVPALNRHFADAADDDVVDHHRRIRFQRTDIGDLDVIDVSPRTAPRRARQRQRVQPAEGTSGHGQHQAAADAEHPPDGNARAHGC